MFNLSKNANLSMKKMNSLCSAQLRIEKDLLELKKFKLSTRVFNTTYSNVFKCLDENLFKMYVSLESLVNREIYIVKLELNY